MGKKKSKAQNAGTVAAKVVAAGVKAAERAGGAKPAKTAAAKAVAKVEAKAERKDPLVSSQHDPYHHKSSAMPSVAGSMAGLAGALQKASAGDIPTAVAALDARYNPEAESNLVGVPGDDGTYTYCFTCETRVAMTWASDTNYLYGVAQFIPTLFGNVCTNTATTFPSYGSFGCQTTNSGMNANLQSSILTYKPVSGGIGIVDFDPETAIAGELFAGWSQVVLMPPTWSVGDPSQITVNQLCGFQADADWSALSDTGMRDVVLPWKGGSAAVEGRDWWPKNCNGANDYVYNQCGDLPTIVVRRALGSAYANVSVRAWLTVQCHLAVGGNVMVSSGAPCTQLRPDATLMDRIEYVLLEAAGYEGGHMTIPMLESVKKALRGMMKGVRDAKGLSVWKRGAMGIAGALGGLFGEVSPRQLSKHYAQQAEQPGKYTDLELCMIYFCPYRSRVNVQRLFAGDSDLSYTRALKTLRELTTEKEERLLAQRRAVSRERAAPGGSADGASDSAVVECLVRMLKQYMDPGSVVLHGDDVAVAVPRSAVEDGFALVGSGEPESPEDTEADNPAIAPGPSKPRALVPISVTRGAAMRPGGGAK